MIIFRNFCSTSSFRTPRVFSSKRKNIGRFYLRTRHLHDPSSLLFNNRQDFAVKVPCVSMNLKCRDFNAISRSVNKETLHVFDPLRVNKRLYHQSNKTSRSSERKEYTSWSSTGYKNLYTLSIGGTIAIILFTSLFPLFDEKDHFLHAEARNDPSRKVYTCDEVSKHNSLSKGVWVIHGDGVYDITEFISQHPGGKEKIMMAAGKSIDTFWSVYTVHHKQEVYDILENYRIGDIDLESLKSLNDEPEIEDPFAGDPIRPNSFIVRSERPFNAEPLPEKLWSSGEITDNQTFYIRNHFPVPTKLSEDNHYLVVSVPDVLESTEKKLDQTDIPLKKSMYSVEELKTKFPQHKIKATLQCAGNRRSDMSVQKQTQGLQWGTTAIGNAEWTGVYLSDILRDAGFNFGGEKETDEVNINNETCIQRKIHHVVFQGVEGYEASIPITKAIHPLGDVLIAFEMNGEPIPQDHGFPLRVIVPGHVAARSVKWLKSITLSPEEAHSVWQRKDYKVVPPWTTPDQLQEAYLHAVSIQDTPIQSAFLTNLSQDSRNMIGNSQNEGTLKKSKDGKIQLGGYAFSGGGRGVARVDVSIDGGRTWTSAELKENEESSRTKANGRKWDWTVWEAQISVPSGSKTLDLVCRAVDTSNNIQPELHAYNIRGLLSTGWHRMRVNIE